MALYFSCGKTSGPKATRDYRPRSSTFLGLQRMKDALDVIKGHQAPKVEPDKENKDDINFSM